ncbi:Ribosome maturation protein SDO1 [Diplonema papillatum]|nr:Ribosome maturation protein SDO1 [Diplonema papillatum]
MSRQTLPSNQQRHDNVSTVKLKAGGCKFVVACYRNKAQSYRKGVEKDIEEVLQIERVFTNVHQGMFAKIEEVRKHLGPKIPGSKAMPDSELERAACKLILDRGEMQLNEMERTAGVDAMLNDIVTFVSERTVHPQSRRPYPPAMIHSSLQKVGFTPIPRKSAKTQALEAIKVLKSVLAIERAPMLLRATLLVGQLEAFKTALAEIKGADIVKVVQPTAHDDDVQTVDLLIPPDAYRTVDEIVSAGGSEWSLQVLANGVSRTAEGELNYDALASRPPASSFATISEQDDGEHLVRSGADESPGERAQKAQQEPASRSAKLAAKRAQRKDKKKAQNGAGSNDEANNGNNNNNNSNNGDAASQEDDEKARGGRAKGKKRGKVKDAGPSAKAKAKQQLQQEQQAAAPAEGGADDEEEDFLSSRAALKLAAKRRKDEQQKLDLMKEDPNFNACSDDDLFGSDFGDVYENSDEELDMEEILARRMTKKREAELLKQQEEDEAAVKKTEDTRAGTSKKKKRRDKRTGRRLDSDEEED